MAKVNWKGATMLYPVPAVLVTTGNMEKSNVLTVAWVGIISSDPPRAYISVRPERYSYEMIKETKEFCINLPTAAMTKELDYCGVKSGKDVDKFEYCKFTKGASPSISCPRIEESPISMDCKVFDIIDVGSHTMFLADILNVGVREELIDETGKLNLAKSGLMAYSHGSYFKMGAKTGTFGFSVKKKVQRKVYPNSYGKSSAYDKKKK
ncbi:MAG: flavin reductase family protein [Oscillospiraceae bacterium]